MLDLLQNTVNLLVSDSALATLMGTVIPNKNILVGPRDIVIEKQNELRFPTIILHAISESFRTVPRSARDSRIQLDIWSRTSELDAAKMYERVFQVLNFQSGDKNTSHIFWQRGEGLTEEFITEIRLWKWTGDLIMWSI